MSKILLFCCNIGFVAIYVLLWQICFVAIYALLCGEKIIQKLHMWRKNDKYEVCLKCQPLNNDLPKTKENRSVEKENLT